MVVHWIILGLLAALKPRTPALLITENLCLRQQLVVLKHKHERPTCAIGIDDFGF